MGYYLGFRVTLGSYTDNGEENGSYLRFHPSSDTRAAAYFHDIS